MRPRKSKSANTRLFFGVEREIRVEKSEFAFNLKAAHIAAILAVRNRAVRYWLRGFLL